MLTAALLVVDPHARRPAVTVVRADAPAPPASPDARSPDSPHLAWPCAVVDRRPVVQGDDWAAAVRLVAARQPATPAGALAALVLVTPTWPDDAEAERGSGPGAASAQARAAQRRADRVRCDALAAELGLPGVLVDAGTCRGLGEATFGVGRELGDHVHLGVGLSASGVRLDGQWRQHPAGRAWSADRTVVDPGGAPHGGDGHGWLSDWTAAQGLAAQAQLLGHALPLAAPAGDVRSTALHSAAALRPLLDGLRRHEALSLAVADDTGDALGQVLGGLINTLDLAEVVLHVAPEALRAPLVAAAERSLVRHSFASLRAGLRWHQPVLGDDAVALGAAAWWALRSPPVPGNDAVQGPRHAAGSARR